MTGILLEILVISISTVFFSKIISSALLFSILIFAYVYYLQSRIRLFHGKQVFLALLIVIIGFSISFSRLQLNNNNNNNNNVTYETISEIRINSFPFRSEFGFNYRGCLYINNSCKQEINVYSNEILNFKSVYQLSGKWNNVSHETNEDNPFDVKLPVFSVRKVLYENDRLFFYTIVQKTHNYILDLFHDLQFPSNQIMPGIIIGSKEYLDYSLSDSFKESGLIHLLVLSGYNIMIVGFICNRIGSVISRKMGIIISILGMWGLVVISGTEFPAIRAGIMATIAVIFARNLNIQNRFRLLLYAIVIILLFRPDSIYSYSFILSVLATFGVLIYSEVIRVLLKIKESIFSNILIPLFGVNLLLAPILFELSHSYNPLSLLANIIAIPLVPTLTIMGIVYIFAPISVIAYLINTFSSFLLYITTIFSSTNIAFANVFISHETLEIIVVGQILFSIYIIKTWNNYDYNNQ